jgi:hypothetical protein
MVAYAWFGLLVALAWFCAVNLFFCGLVLAAQPLLRRRLAGNNMPAMALAARLLPAYGSLVIVIGLVGPAYALFEPRGVEEQLGWMTRALVTGGCILGLMGVLRGLRAMRRTSRALASYVASARPVSGVTEAIPVFSVKGAPGVVLAGVLRPRLYVSRDVLATLTAEELKVAVAHEAAHQRAWDNAKRRLIAFAPDILGLTRRGTDIESGWRAAAETAADAAATDRSEAAAVSLASALVKVARLSAGRTAGDDTCSTFHNGEFLAARIRRLLAGPRDPDRAPLASTAMIGAAVFTLLGSIVSGSAILRVVQTATEWLVRLP